MSKYIKPMSNINKITCVWKTCISVMLLETYLNKWKIPQVYKLYKLYINYVSTLILQISKNDFIENKNKIFPNNLHIHLRACDAASSYNCPSPIIVSNSNKWNCILSVVIILQGLMLHIYNHQNNLIISFMLPFIELNSIYFKKI